MAKHAKPYLKCEKLAGLLRLTLMAGGSNGHILKGRKLIARGDPDLLAKTIKEMLEDARGRPEA